MVEYGSKKGETTKIAEKSARRTSEPGTRKVTGKVRDVTENIRGFDVNDYRDRMLDRVDDFSTEVDRNMDNVKTGIRDHPLESMALAAGAGLLLGAYVALAGRRASRRYPRT